MSFIITVQSMIWFKTSFLKKVALYHGHVTTRVWNDFPRQSRYSGYFIDQYPIFQADYNKYKEDLYLIYKEKIHKQAIDRGLNKKRETRCSIYSIGSNFAVKSILKLKTKYLSVTKDTFSNKAVNLAQSAFVKMKDKFFFHFQLQVHQCVEIYLTNDL